MRVRSTCLDGGVLTLESTDQDLTARQTHIMRIGSGGRVFELSASRRQEGTSVADALAVSLDTGPYGERHGYRGAHLRFANGRDVDRTSRAVDEVLLAAWEGAHHAVVFPSYHSTAKDATALLENFRFEETSDGVTCTPSARGATRFPAEVVQEISGVGLLEIAFLSEEVRRTLPPWEGTKLPSGELFEDTLGNGEPYYILVSQTARAIVMPFPGVTGRDVQRRLGDVFMTWSEAA